MFSGTPKNADAPAVQMGQKRFFMILDPSYLRKTMIKKWQVLNHFEITVKILVGKVF